MQNRQRSEGVFRSLGLLKTDGEGLLARWAVSIAVSLQGISQGRTPLPRSRNLLKAAIAAFLHFAPLPSPVLLSLSFVHALILIQWQSKPNLSLAKIATKLKFVYFVFILRLYFQI